MTNTHPETSAPKLSLKSPAILIATWFGSGFMRPAPGTWGSLAAIPVGAIIFGFGGIYALITATFIAYIAGVWAARIFDEKTGEHDSKMIVIDEVVGQWIALTPAFVLMGLSSPLYILAAFVMFRFFDILKPWPCCFFDKSVQNAHGVMLDDVIAGLYAAVFVFGIHTGLLYV
jgi:phosphatidylglycerophosphatase A